MYTKHVIWYIAFLIVALPLSANISQSQPASSALTDAVESGDIARVKELMYPHSSLDMLLYVNTDNQTPFEIAQRRGYIAIMRILRNRINCPCENGETVLMNAVLELPSLSSPDYDGQRQTTPVTGDTIELLLRAGALPTLSGTTDASALEIAASKGQYWVLERLLQYLPNRERALYYKRRTAYIITDQYGIHGYDDSLPAAFFQLFADPEFTDHDRTTLIHKMCNKKHTTQATLNLLYYVYSYMPDLKQHFLLSAIRNDNFALFKLIEDIDGQEGWVFAHNMENDVLCEALNSESRELFAYILRNAHNSVLKQIWKSPDVSGNTILHTLIKRDDASALHILIRTLQERSDNNTESLLHELIQTKNQNGDTPIESIDQSKPHSTEIIRTLLKHGAHLEHDSATRFAKTFFAHPYYIVHNDNRNIDAYYNAAIMDTVLTYYTAKHITITPEMVDLCIDGGTPYRSVIRHPKHCNSIQSIPRSRVVALLVAHGYDITQSKKQLTYFMSTGNVSTADTPMFWFTDDVLSFTTNLHTYSAFKPLLTTPHNLLYKDLADTDGMTPLMWAIVRNKQAVANTLLKEHPNTIDQTDTNGNTALLWACKLGRPQYITKLLYAGANHKKTDKYGTTPLEYAAQNGNIETVGKLITQRYYSTHDLMSAAYHASHMGHIYTAGSLYVFANTGYMFIN